MKDGFSSRRASGDGNTPCHARKSGSIDSAIFDAAWLRAAALRSIASSETKKRGTTVTGDERHAGLHRRDVLKVLGLTTAAGFSGGILSATSAFAAGSTVVIAAPATPQSLDSEFDGSLGTIDCIGALYDSLIEFATIPDPELPDVMREDIRDYPDKPGGVNVVGKLAESWQLDPAGKWLEFKLREGVKSAWGNELTAQDVKWTWDRKFALGAIGGFFVKLMGMSGPDNVKVVDKYVVRFELPQAQPLLLKLQLNLYNNIYDSTKCKEMATTDDPWAKDFISNNGAGFGPYELTAIKRGQQAVFKAREDYYRGKPAVDTIIYKEVPTSATRASLIQGGAVDVSLVLQPLEVEKLKQAAGVVVETVKASPMFWVELNAKFEPFDKIAVRQAMNHAFPRDQILASIFRGTASPMTGVMPGIYPGFVDGTAAYPYDLAKAKALLAEAGLPDGFATTIAYNAGDPVQEPMAILYQTSLREIGVELTLKKIPAGTFFNEVSGRTQPMIFFTDTPWCPDPGYSMQLYFDSGTFSNYGNYANAEVDALLREAAVTAENGKRYELMGKAQEIIGREAPWVFISYPNFTIARREQLKGFTYYTSNNLRFQDFDKA